MRQPGPANDVGDFADAKGTEINGFKNGEVLYVVDGSKEALQLLQRKYLRQKMGGPGIGNIIQAQRLFNYFFKEVVKSGRAAFMIGLCPGFFQQKVFNIFNRFIAVVLVVFVKNNTQATGVGNNGGRGIVAQLQLPS